MATTAIGVNAGDVWRILATLVGFSLLLPMKSADRARRLAQVSRSTHRRLIRLELRRRLMNDSADEFRRDARAQLASGELDIAKFDERQQIFDTEDPSRSRPPDWIRIREAAFESSCGYTSWANARFAALVGLTLALPYIIYEEISLFELVNGYTLEDQNTPIVNAAAISLYLLRWAAYGLVFGYFYPLLRGRSPVGKSLVLWLVILPVEVIPLLDGTWGDTHHLTAAIAIRSGQLLVVALGLGVAWEVRTMRAGGFPWTRLRNFRNLRSLGTPIVAVLVAASTAAATVLASTTVSKILEPHSVTQTSTPHSQSTEP
jgi:hypothetical protein